MCSFVVFSKINITISIAYRFSDVIKPLTLANILSYQGKNFPKTFSKNITEYNFFKKL